MTLDAYRNSLLPSERRLFDEFVDIGIVKTIYALLDAKVEEQEIKRVVTMYWDISNDEFIDFFTQSRINAALDLLWEHLRLKGYSELQADDFIDANSIKNRLLHNHELLKYWNNPEKLIKAIQQKKKSKE